MAQEVRKMIAKKFKNIEYVILLPTLLFACTPDPLEVENIPSLQPQIVVSTQIVPNQSIVVFLTHTIGALDAGKGTDPQSLINQIVVQDAFVTITHNNVVDTLINLSNGLYGGANIPIVKDQLYTLSINSPTLGKVVATTQAKAYIPFLNVDATLYKTEYDSLASVKYSIEDPIGKNFYMVNIQKFSATQDVASLLNPRLFTHVVKDDEFNGKTFEEEFKAFFQHYSEGDTVAVSLTNISEAYYKYVKTRVDNRFSAASFATEPFNYPSNVKDGYGFFVMQQPDVRIFVLK